MVPDQESKSTGPPLTWVFLIALFCLQRIPSLQIPQPVPYEMTLFSEAKVIGPKGSPHCLPMSTS